MGTSGHVEVGWEASRKLARLGASWMALTAAPDRREVHPPRTLFLWLQPPTMSSPDSGQQQTSLPLAKYLSSTGESLIPTMRLLGLIFGA